MTTSFGEYLESDLKSIEITLNWTNDPTNNGNLDIMWDTDPSDNFANFAGDDQTGQMGAMSDTFILKVDKSMIKNGVLEIGAGAQNNVVTTGLAFQMTFVLKYG